MNSDDDDRVSLAPLDPEAALRALLAVDPDAGPTDESLTPDADIPADDEGDTGDHS